MWWRRFYVLEGSVDFVCGEERFRAGPGAFVYLPPCSCPGGVENVGPRLERVPSAHED